MTCYREGKHSRYLKNPEKISPNHLKNVATYYLFMWSVKTFDSSVLDRFMETLFADQHLAKVLRRCCEKILKEKLQAILRSEHRRAIDAISPVSRKSHCSKAVRFKEYNMMTIDSLRGTRVRVPMKKRSTHKVIKVPPRRM